MQKLDPTVELPRAYEQLPHDGHAWPEVARLLLRVSHDRGDRERVSKIADDLSSEGIVLDENRRQHSSYEPSAPAMRTRE